MPDPAVEAAQRAIGNVSPDEFTNEVGDTALAASREALRPIRELHKREGGGTPTGEYADMCYECQDYWPCGTAKLIYSSEELAQ